MAAATGMSASSRRLHRSSYSRGGVDFEPDTPVRRDTPCRRRVDGIIIEPIEPNHDYLDPDIASGLPVVAVDRPCAGILADDVISDNAATPSTCCRPA
jgi:hypothetical protein